MKLISRILVIIMILNIFMLISFADQSPSISAQSAIVIDARTGRVLYEHNANNKMPMASTTKIMTALLAIQNNNLNDLVKIKPESTNIEGSSIYLKEGEVIKLKDLLYGLMLCSGNDAACAIAQHVGGNVEQFSQMMNNKVTELGLNDTNFMNPHGLNNQNHFTTAYDLAMISKEAMQHNTFKNVVGTKLWIAQREGDRYKYFYNKNKVISQYEYGTGIKIGYTKRSGRCLVASSKKGELELICVVLNAPNWFNDSYRLMDYVFNKYKPTKIIDENQIFKTVPVRNGTKEYTKIIAQQKSILPLTDEEKKQISILYSVQDYLTAPVTRKNKIGTAKIYLDDQLLDSVNMITREDIDYKKLNIFQQLKCLTVDKIIKKD
ncbi:MAG: D-alanyl-D-alanine carboxypeptidase [Clostridia bacterium]|nr:D-alanyl-D-alanine carboxypeptidase [Clostridia bacterium]